LLVVAVAAEHALAILAVRFALAVVTARAGRAQLAAVIDTVLGVNALVHSLVLVAKQAETEIGVASRNALVAGAFAVAVLHVRAVSLAAFVVIEHA